jgi:hypothetical protein
MALAKVFQGKFCAGLQQLYAGKQFQFHGQLGPLSQPKHFRRLMRQANRHRWVVYAKRPFAGPRQVLAYLSRYTHRVAISPRRLLALDTKSQTVTFAWKDYADRQKQKTMALGLAEFVRRFALHLLPERFVKIRHYGLLSNSQRQTKLAQARALLTKQTPAHPFLTAAADSSQPSTPKPPLLRLCPHCGSDQLRLIEIVLPRGSVSQPPMDSS